MHTILLIDDDPQIRKAFGLALQHHGYRVLEADSGETGLETAKLHLPDLILTDIGMPGGDGQTLLCHIRQSPELNTKQVVLMTGRPDLVPLRTGMEAGADDFLIKPISLASLLSCVEARLRRAEIHWRVEDRNLEKLRSSLLATLPHELFTPLAGMMGLSDYLHANATMISLEEMKELHNDIYFSGLRLHRTLTNYFRLLGLENESSKLEERTLLPAFEVRAVILAAIDTVLARPGALRTIAVKVEELPLWVHRDDLKTIVEELVDNARKFSGIGTEIRVVLETDGTLSVANKGKGMSAEQIRQVGAFQQFDRHKQAQEGLGLGLVLVQKLAERNKATFTLESQLGQGAKVSIALEKERQTA
jgi:signal transduction histidine kinase